MNILLLNPKLKSWSPNVYVPLGLTYIAAVLEQAGHDVAIIDLNVQKLKDGDLRQKIARADVVGITGMIPEYEEILKLIGFAKEANSAAIVVLGGPLATTLPQQLLQVSPADFVVIGEGERTIVTLLAALKNNGRLADVRGIAYKVDHQVILSEPAEHITDLDTIPLPARHLLDMKRYLIDYFVSFGFKIKEFGKIKSTNLITSRGCPYSCTFCFKDMWGNQWRARSPQNIVAEMESLYDKYGVNGIIFNDDTFVLDRPRVLELCQLIKERHLEVVWYCNGRVNLMTQELLKAMYDAGCRGVAYGIESGNQQILNTMKKNITLDQIRNVVRWTKDVGIKTVGYFMIGMLGETKADIEETITFAQELDLDFYGFSLTTPLFGTELYDSARKTGLIPDSVTSLGDWSLYVNANLTQDCSKAELAAFENSTFKEFYLKRRFGQHYFINPGFWREATRTLLSLRHREQAQELATKAKSILRSYRYNRGKG